MLGTESPRQPVTFGKLVQQSRTLESRNPEDDPGIFHIESPQGEALVVEADRLQEQAEQAVRDESFQDATGLYTEAILNAIQVRSNCIQQASLFKGRSAALCKLQKFDIARSDASMIMNCMPSDPIGFLHLARVLTVQKRYTDALVVANLGLNQDLTHRELVQYAKCIVELKAELKDTSLANYSISSEVWIQVTKQLVSEKRWSALAVVWLNTDTKPCITSFDAQDVNLSELVLCYVSSWKDWAQSLVVQFLTNGASYETICPKSEYPYHAALKVGLKTGTYELLSHLLQNHPVESSIIQDEKRNSLFHVACSYKNSQKSRHGAVKVLLDFGLDASARNDSGKMPHELLAEDDPDTELIRQYIAAKSPSGMFGDTKGIVQNTSSAPGAPRHTTTDSSELPVLEWSNHRVRQWLEQQDLGHHKIKFQLFDGQMLRELQMMQDLAPETFCRMLENVLQLPLVDLLAFSSALRQLSS